MKKVLAIIFGSVFVLALAAYLYRNELGMAMMMMTLKPDQSFAADNTPAGPDYANPEHWAALPMRQDKADVSPRGLALDQQASAAADVFFIHPTTYYKDDHWNQPLTDAETNTFTDEQVLQNQASVFNSCCKIYAPRYRQATLYAFMDGEDGPAAIDLAYQDVRAAFDHYMTYYNKGRPFIIAGHSQGGKHADTLLAEIKDTVLMNQLVAAYPVCYFLYGSNGIAVCEHATQIACQVTWNSLAPDAASFRDTTRDICVNPLSWRIAGQHADFSANLGAVSFSANGEVEPGVADAQCVDGKLYVSEVRSENYSSRMFGPGNYHVYDFSFFHMNIRQNAEARVQAFLNP